MHPAFRHPFLLSALLAALRSPGQWTAEPQVPATDVPSLFADGNGLYVGTDERVHRSADGVAFEAGAVLPGAPAFIDVLVRVGADLFAGTGGNGVLVSSDDGDSWQDLSQGLTGLGSLHVSGVAWFNGELYCATMGAGVFKRVGGSWQSFGGLGGNTTANVPLLKEVDGRLYAGAGGNGFLWRLDPGGTVFAPLQVGPLQSEPFVITDIVRMDGDLFVGSTYGVYRSTDDGASWSPVVNGPQAGERLLFLDAGPVVLLLSAGTTSRLYRTLDQGSTWDLLDVMPTTYGIAHHQGRLYAGRTDGLWYRDDLITGEGEGPEPFTFAAYPVPVRDELTVDLGAPGVAHYRFHDPHGRLVREGSLQGPVDRLSVQQLAEGVYELHVLHGGRSASRRIVVR